MVRTLLMTTAMLCTGALLADDHTAKAEVIAVKFHADWCGSCKAMGPVFSELEAKFDTQPVLYLTLDHTREHQRQQAMWLVQELGMDNVWAEYGGKTGFILLIDADSKEVLTKLTRENNLKDMGAQLKEAVAKASAQ